MTLLTDENLFGKFVPKPTISKITLQSSGNPPKRLNPHIDDARTEGVTRTSGIVEGTLDSQSTPDNLKIILNLSVKDKLRDLQNSWFADVNPMLKNANGSSGEFDLKNYVTIKVFQSKSQNTSNIILSADDSIEKLKDILVNNVLNIPHAENTDWKQISLSSMKDPNNVEVISDTSTAVGGPSNLKYYDIPYSMDFERTEKYPDYLCYFVWAEFDLSAIADEFEFDVTGFEDATDLFKDMNFSSQLSHYVALSSGKVPSTINRFFIDDDAAVNNKGSLWTGPVNQLSDGRWQTQNQPAYFLKKTRSENTLIQDFRAVDRLNKLNLDFSIVQNSLKGNLSLASKMRTANINLDPPNKYFTDIMITRDEDENSRFFFSLDVAAIMEKNSPFGNLFVNPGTKQRCLEETKIISMSLHRIRLKGSPEIGSKPIFGPPLLGKRQPKRFNENNEFLTSFPSSNQTTENDDLILMASYDNNDALRYIAFDGQDSSISDITEGIYKGPNPKDGIKCFAGVDKSVRFKTDGYYQYRVVIKFEDGAVNYLISQLESLWTAKQNLSEYYAEASKLGTSHSKNPFTNPHAYDPNAPQPTWDIPEGGIRPGNFNVSANRFTQEFNKFATTRVNTGRVDEATGAPIFTPPWHPNVLRNPPWLSAATTYVDIMNSLSGFNFETSEQADVRSMIGTIKNYMSPETGNIEGILKVFSLIESLENIISNAIGRVKSPPGGSAKNISRQNPNQNPKLLLSGKTVLPMPEKKDTTLKLVKIDHTFNNIFNANLPKDTGINMFTNFTNDLVGLRTMTRDNFNSSVANEMAKIFQVSSDTSLYTPEYTFSNTLSRAQFPLSDTSHTYFTPSIIKTTSTSINLNPADDTAGNYSSWPDKDEWGRVGISDDMSQYQARGSFGVAGRAGDPANDGDYQWWGVGGLSSKVASFVGSNYNLIALETTSTGEVREPKPATAFDESVGPRGSFISRPGDTLIRGENHSYLRENKEALENNKLGYNIFSSITQTFNKNGKKDMSRYAPLSPEGYINKAGKDRHEFSGLPNPVKALFVYGDSFQTGQGVGAGGQQVLTSNAQKLFDNGGFGGDESIKMAMRYLFETIFVLEVFVGWQDNRMIEIWEPFTINNTPTDRELLCRFRRYENPKYGVMGDNASSLPIYDQYFILRRGRWTRTGAATEAQTAGEVFGELVS